MKNVYSTTIYSWGYVNQHGMMLPSLYSQLLLNHKVVRCKYHTFYLMMRALLYKCKSMGL